MCLINLARDSRPVWACQGSACDGEWLGWMWNESGHLPKISFFFPLLLEVVIERLVGGFKYLFIFHPFWDYGKNT